MTSIAVAPEGESTQECSGSLYSSNRGKGCGECRRFNRFGDITAGSVKRCRAGVETWKQTASGGGVGADRVVYKRCVGGKGFAIVVPGEFQRESTLLPSGSRRRHLLF